jgi:hypothetical protein
MNDLIFLTAQELAVAIRQRQVPTVEVLEAYHSSPRTAVAFVAGGLDRRLWRRARDR